MATLILSTVGSALGGPVGGVLGSLVGQSIDQSILGSRRGGPRLGDLSVQTSSYGTPIPRIYGSMRVAGTVVWSTDLVESGTASGAKGQPDVVYSYSVSLAVALSSRPAGTVRRIWADGKLLRGERGDFKVSTGFRYYDAREDQPLDPLIASIEGATNTPAYRGLALAVFENLELAEYGNRIPFLTFEIEADPEPPTIGGILADASFGHIDSRPPDTVVGYAAHGRSVEEAIAPLVDAFGISLLDDGDRLVSRTAADAVSVQSDELGCAVDGDTAARMERTQAAVRSLPSALLVNFYDPQRDYQTGQSRAEVVDRNSTEETVDLPAVLEAVAARSLVEDMIARRWAQRDKLILRLPPRLIPLVPGDTAEVPGASGSWQIFRSTIDGMINVVELRRAWRPEALIEADAGRALTADDVVIDDVALALVELPDVSGRAGSTPTVYVAASTATSAWKRLAVEVSSAQFSIGICTASRKALMGTAQTILADGSMDDPDTVSSVEVELIDAGQWLTSCDDDALAGGANLALIGDELLQFGDAEAIGPGRFRLTRLLRGQYGTEWARGAHASGDLFLMIDPASLQSVSLPASARGSVVTASVRIGESTVTASRLVDGRSLRTGLFVAGEQVVGARLNAISGPSGGTMVDSEARTAVAQILAAMRQHGLIET